MTSLAEELVGNEPAQGGLAQGGLGQSGLVQDGLVPGELARGELIGDDLVARSGGRRVAFGSWTDAVRRSVLSFRFDCDRPRSFAGAISNRTLAGVNFVNMACGRHEAHRDRATISPQDAGYYVLTLQLSGQLRLRQHGREAVVTPGRYAVYDASEPASLTASDDYRSTCIRFPKRYLGVREDDPLRHITATAFDCEPGLPAAAWGALISLNRNLGALGPHGPSAVHDVMNMVSTLLQQLGQRAPARRSSELLLEQVREHVEANLGDPDLGPAGIAAAHHVSPRHLHALFEGTGTTVARWIRQRRVELCRRDLADPAMVEVPVSAIATRWGFRGPSRFHEAFKQLVGCTPVEFRREALQARTPGSRSPRA